ncbi:MAG TPA: M28 family peptidase [Bryobacteraceae bacterium]|jgi:N-acetylated-alpha-linked acidic dipeptidase
MKHPVLALLLALSIVEAQNPIRGFPPEQAAAERELESKARDIPQSERIRTYLERMSAKPHHAGSPGSKAVADYATALMREWGLDAKQETFEALLPYPTARGLEMTSPVYYKAKLQEPAISEDKDSGESGQLPTFNAYSASGDVTAQLVYANYGLPEDYELLKKHGVDVKGKIVITRYGGGWRGIKPKIAQEMGAVGCLIYSDPKEDGYYRGDVYPKGAFRPAQGVQRGSVMDMPVEVGDPLTPGWASEKGAKRISREESKVLMKIPVMPISYGDAEPLLRALNGPVVPEPWRGALPVTYHMGPGPATVHMKTDFDWTNKPLNDVITIIPGSVYKDQWVIYGNHHDAWVNGASDPLSGASSLLETARTLAMLMKQGWKPKRTIVLALWDGEEFGLVGSTEWVEKHQAELDQKAVFYMNSDSNGRGRIGAQGSHGLEQFVAEVLRDLQDPEKGKSLLELTRNRGNKESGFHLGALGAGSDYVAFIDHVGISSLNLGFGGESSGGVYHSIYDTFNWFTTYSDKDLTYGRMLSQVTTTILLRLADAPVLPYQFLDLAKTVKGYVEEIQKDFPNTDVKEINAQLGRVYAAAKMYDEDLAMLVKKAAGASPDKLAKLNQTLYRSERALTLPQGLPGRDWYKHELYAPGLLTGYGAKTLPGVREASEAGKTDEANGQAKMVSKALRNYANQVEEADRLLRSMD